jgi:hypothetical protein
MKTTLGRVAAQIAFAVQMNKTANWIVNLIVMVTFYVPNKAPIYMFRKYQEMPPADVCNYR